MKGKSKPKMAMKKMAGKKMAKTDAMPMKGKGKLMKRLENQPL